MIAMFAQQSALASIVQVLGVVAPSVAAEIFEDKLSCNAFIKSAVSMTAFKVNV